MRQGLNFGGMKAPLYRLVILLMGISAVGMVGLQSGFLYRQYQQSLANFDFNVQRAVNYTLNAYARWNSHTSSPEDQASFNALYSNPDTTFTFMIAQSAQAYPLLDFEPDTVLPKLRKEQFLKFKAELEATRRAENKRLHEFYIFRTIQYCADCQEDSLSIAEIFPLDSLIRSQLAAHQVTTGAQIGFFHQGRQAFSYLPAGADAERLSQTPYAYDFSPYEQLRLYFPHKKRVLAAALAWPAAASLVLVLVSLCGFWLALRVIFRQKQLSELKNDFINNVTHEFKTPISTIAFAVANIENEQTIHQPEAIRQFTKVIRDENKRLNSQVEKVLQTALSGSKALEMKQESVNLHAIINDLADACELKIKGRGAVHRKLNAARAQVIGDEFHLSNAISNLLDNAQKYSNGTVDITLSTESEEAGIVIRVADKGPGISKEHLPLVFDKFYRVPQGNVHNVKGFGLGLSYVKEIVEKHQGQVRASSKPGQGSVFAVFLPFERQS